MAFAIAPATPDWPPLHDSPVAPSVTRGEDLANHVSSCVACHTDRGPDGKLVGPRFSGGQRMDVAADPTKVYVSPNLTPDPDTSPIGTWSEDAFIARFRVGPTIRGHAHAVGRLRAHDRRRPAIGLSLPPLASANTESCGPTGTTKTSGVTTAGFAAQRKTLRVFRVVRGPTRETLRVVRGPTEKPSAGCVVRGPI